MTTEESSKRQTHLNIACTHDTQGWVARTFVRAKLMIPDSRRIHLNWDNHSSYNFTKSRPSFREKQLNGTINLSLIGLTHFCLITAKSKIAIIKLCSIDFKYLSTSIFTPGIFFLVRCRCNSRHLGTPAHGWLQPIGYTSTVCNLAMETQAKHGHGKTQLHSNVSSVGNMQNTTTMDLYVPLAVWNGQH